VEDRWRFTGTLRFIRAGRPYSVILFWNRDSYREADAWYVNVEKPMRRTALGFDYLDLWLDAVVAPNRCDWQWKDEDEFADAVALGLVAPDEALTLKAAAQSAIDDIMHSRPPYLDEWVGWRPPSDWNVPGLSDGWRRV
jgi:predicted RNA-binding protein associated with RNAse of E/G family